MVTTARANLSIWHNDDVYEYPIEVRGLDLRPLALAMQVRLRGDTSDAPILNLTKVTSINAEGLRVAAVRTEDGITISDIQVRINRSTWQSLPYIGETDDSMAFEYALLIAGHTRLVGSLALLAHAYGSGGEQFDRSYGTAAQAPTPTVGLRMTIAGDDVTSLTLDSIDLVQALVARAEAAAADAEASEAEAAAAALSAKAARDAAIAASQAYPNVEDGLAASVDGQYFSVVGTSLVALSLYRREAGVAILKASFPSLSGLAGYGTIAQVATEEEIDQAPIINALLADPTIVTVILPSGLIWTGQTVVVPANKTLILQSDTILRTLPAPNFTFVEGMNHVVLLAGNRAQIRGGTVDMNKYGLGEAGANRCNGVTVADGARDCIRQDVVIMNCTGYASYDAGSDNHLNPPSSYNHDVRTLNSQVHFEQQAADGSVYINCHARDGDGDIGCLSMWHPVAGPSNLTFIGCTGIGEAATIWEITANVAPIDNIEIIGGRFERTTPGGVCFTSTANIANRIRGVRVTGATFIAPVGYGAGLYNLEGSFANCRFEGGYGVQVSNAQVTFDGSTIKASDPTPGSQRVTRGIIALDGISSVRWDGGEISAVGAAGSSVSARVGIEISPFTRLVPPAQAGSTIKRSTLGVTPIIGDAANCYATILVPWDDPEKIYLTFSVQAQGTAQAVTGTASPYWVIVENGRIRVRINGINYAGKGYQLRWRLDEVS